MLKHTLLLRLKKIFIAIISLTFLISGCAGASSSLKTAGHKSCHDIIILTADSEKTYQVLGEISVKAANPFIPVSMDDLNKRLQKMAHKEYRNADAVINVKYDTITFAEGILDLQIGRNAKGTAVRFINAYKNDTAEIDSAAKFTVESNKSAVPKGNRMLGFSISTPGNGDYESIFNIAKETGMQITELHLTWDSIEASPANYGNEYLDIANSYYPARDIQIALTIAVIDTNNNRVPSDLRSRRFDDPQVIDRYNKMIDYVFSQIRDLELVSLSIGNEIDVYLGKDKAKWAQYEVFFKTTGDYARAKRPGLKIGAKATFNGLTRDNREDLKALNQYSDVIMVTYYPLNSDFTVREPSAVRKDFKKLVSSYKDKPIYMLEVGYPASRVCNSSETKQAEFIQEIFKSWDVYSSQIELINYNWLNDKAGTEVANFVKYYGIHSNGFREYLLTLGLLGYDGKDKQAFKILKTEAEIRGWQKKGEGL